MSQLQLKDGSFREFTPGQSAAEIVKEIGMGLYKAACCVKINGEVCDLRTPVTEDCTFEVCTFDDQTARKPSGTRLLMSSLRLLSGCIQTQSLRLVQQSTAVSTMISM